MFDDDNNYSGCSPEGCASCAGCGPDYSQLPRSISLTLEDDTVVECAVLTIFPADGREYIALMPMDEDAAEAGEVYLYRYDQTDDGDPVLSNIEEDDEYDAAAEAFGTIVENAQLVAEAMPEEE